PLHRGIPRGRRSPPLLASHHRCRAGPARAFAVSTLTALFPLRPGTAGPPTPPASTERRLHSRRSAFGWLRCFAVLHREDGRRALTSNPAGPLLAHPAAAAAACR